MSNRTTACLAAAALLLSACQSIDAPPPELTMLSPLYATAADAAAIAAGRFGAVPVAMVADDDLAPAEGCAGAPPKSEPPLAAVCMRTRAGKLGWLPRTAP